MLGKYIISDKPMTEEEWARRACYGDRRRMAAKSAQGLAVH